MSSPTSSSPTFTTAVSTVAVHDSPIGPLVSSWTGHGLRSLRSVTSGELETAGKLPSDPHTRTLDDLLHRYFATGRAAFDSLPLDDSGWTAFARLVYRECRRIPAGTTISYGELAARAGNRSAGRAVGAVMARNRILLVIPCHRVVAAGGGLRGFSAAGGLATKQYLLDLEAA